MLQRRDYHRKQNTLKALRQKALDKNPDEFYFRMTSTKLQDGVHVIKQPREEVTEEQLKIIRTQDLKYVEMKRVAESKSLINSNNQVTIEMPLNIKWKRLDSVLLEMAIAWNLC
eukprot:g46610.t1